MIDANGVQSLLVGAGAFMGTSMAGAGALKLFLSASHAVTRIPDALERTAAATETQAKLIPVLERLESQRGEIENSIAVLARNYEELNDRLRRSDGEYH